MKTIIILGGGSDGLVAANRLREKADKTIRRIFLKINPEFISHLKG